MKTRKHLIIPDTQCKPGVSLEHLRWIGRYAAEKKPDVLVHLGDHWDFPSLCKYDAESERFQRRLIDDIRCGDYGLRLLMKGMGSWRPKLMVFCEGNHDERWQRLLREHPVFRGIAPSPLETAAAEGFRAYPWLQPVVVDGVAYCHQFVRSANGNVMPTGLRMGAPNAKAQAQREMRSCTAGHKPGFDYSIIPAGNRTVHGLIAGSCYMHREEYQGPQGNRYWRGIVVKHEVRRGEYDLMKVSLSFLKQRYS